MGELLQNDRVQLRRKSRFARPYWAVKVLMLLMPEPYDPSWNAQFEDLKRRLAAATAVRAAQIEHIGSTAVPGLWAKPVIDIQIGVDDLARFDMAQLDEAGFTSVPDITCDDPFRDTSPNPSSWAKKYARYHEGDRRVAHIHVRQIGHANHRFALLFRDYLRSDAETCQLYSQFKITAARIAGHVSNAGGTGGYLDLKDPFVQLIACRAEDWAAATGWRTPS